MTGLGQDRHALRRLTSSIMRRPRRVLPPARAGSFIGASPSSGAAETNGEGCPIPVIAVPSQGAQFPWRSRRAAGSSAHAFRRRWSSNEQVLRSILWGSTRLHRIHSARRSSLRMDTADSVSLPGPGPALMTCARFERPQQRYGFCRFATNDLSNLAVVRARSRIQSCSGRVPARWRVFTSFRMSVHSGEAAQPPPIRFGCLGGRNADAVWPFRQSG